MSNVHLITKKIRKLLRLSKSPGPEGDRARERAAEIMKRHNLSVELEEMVRRPIAGVAGELWREQLLIAIAQAHRVAYIENVRGPKMAALHGESGAVAAALTLYRKLVLEMAMQCVRGWKSAMNGSGAVFEEAERLWHRVFHLAAVVNLGERIVAAGRPQQQAAVEKPAVRPTPADDEAPRPTLDQRVDAEREVSEQRLASLAEKLGFNAERIQRMAWEAGTYSGTSMDIVSTKLPALPAASVFAVDVAWKVLTPEGRDPLETLRPTLLEVD